MKFSDQTITVLKNFSSINSSILFREGNILRTISPQKTIMAKAEVDETFEKDFAIFDLPRFLGVLSLFDTPEIVVGDKEATIVDDKRKLVYIYADPSTFATPPVKDVTFPIPDVEFTLRTVDLQKVQRAGNVLQLPEIAVIGNGSTISLKAYDSKNPTADSYSAIIGDTEQNFCAIFKNENLKMLVNDYEVSLSSRGISRFISDKLTYWIAVEATSNFN
jgi:hypothetical protein